MAEVLIREYQSSDSLALKQCVIELQDSLREMDARILGGHSIADRYIAHMATRCREEAGKIFVAQMEDDIVGFVIVLSSVKSKEVDEEEYEYAYVSDLVVLVNYRKRGVGRALLKAAESYAANKGARLIRIDVLGKNQAARRLYETCEYQERQVTFEKDLSGPHNGSG